MSNETAVLRDNPLGEPEPTRGVPLEVAPGIWRIVADNPGPMTYHGTNTYLIAYAGQHIVIDPGPDSAGHVDAVLSATAGHLAAILITHAHVDHVGAVKALVARTSATTYGAGRTQEPAFRPDAILGDGEAVHGLTAISTPGHAPDHLCFAAKDGVVFSGDHVMGWSTTSVRPPMGNLAEYLESLEKLAQRDDALFLPGHGPPLPMPRARIDTLIALRLRRERQILELIGEAPRPLDAIVATLYGSLPDSRRSAAAGMVRAHLEKLSDERRARCGEDGLWRID